MISLIMPGNKHLIYKELSIDDLKDDLLDHFNRYQKINNYWKKIMMVYGF